MERIVVGRSATLTQTFTVAPTGTPTVAVIRSDGTAVSTGSVSGAGVTWTYTIPASSNTLLDNYTETWTATQGGEAQTYRGTIEVVGGFLCGLDELRAIFTDTSAYPDAKLRDIRTKAEVSLEKACGRAFVPRYRLETKSVYDGVIHTRADLRTVRSLTVDGTVWSPTDLASLVAEPAGFVNLCRYSSWHRSVLATIGYEYGTDGLDPDITEAVLLVAQEKEGVGSPAGVRSQTADNMTVTYDTRGPGDSFANSRLNSIVNDNRLISVA